MLDVVIITHGLFGEELFQSSEMIVGKQGNVHCLSVLPGKQLSEVVEELDNVIKKANGGVIILTDMFGGSPSNVAFSYAGRTNIEIISGINMPMLLKVFSGRLAGEDLTTLSASCREAGINSIKVAGELIRR
jgi:PTS system mannose-specific IIA component